MPRIYLDTNIVIDYLLKRDYRAERFIEDTMSCRHTLIISDHLLRELLSQRIDCQLFLKVLQLRNKLELVKTTSEQMQQAIDQQKLRCTHLTDALHQIIAEVNGADVLLTKNIKDFRLCHLTKSYDDI